MPEPIGPEFIEKTKYAYAGQSDQEKGLPQPPLEKPLHGGGEMLALPDPAGIDTELRRLVLKRASLRAYSAQPLTLEELSYLLWCCQGVKQNTGQRTYRTVPSAGARHALDTYVLANRVEGFAPGLYRYIALEHRLQALIPGSEIARQVADAALEQDFIYKSAVAFVWVAVVERMAWRYQQRGYRYLYLDAGHACQNLYLAAESIGCGACAIAAYDDDRLNALLCLDGTAEFVIYLAALGKRK